MPPTSSELPPPLKASLHTELLRIKGLFDRGPNVPLDYEADFTGASPPPATPAASAPRPQPAS